MKNYTFAYHQLKFISLLSTVYIHSISFLNQQHHLHLEKVVNIKLLFLFATMSTYFVALAGVSFCLSLQDKIINGRLTEFAFGKVGFYLLVLMLIETVKNSIVFASPASVFHWDFLKFIFVCYLLILLLSRIHIFLNLVVALLIAFLQNPIQNLVKPWRETTIPEMVHLYPDLFNSGHSHYFGFLMCFTFLTIFFLMRSKVPKTGKYFFTLLILGLSYVAWDGFLSQPVSPKDYLTIVNWWVDGVFPPSNKTIFYPLAIWLPSALISFFLCNCRKPLMPTYEKYKTLSLAILIALCLLLYIHISEADFYKFDSLINIWDAKNFYTTNPSHEFFKILLPLTFFLFLSEINQTLHAPKENSLIYKFSISSFLIYLVSTSWTVWIIVQIQQKFSFSISLAIVLVSTTLISWIVAEIGYFFWSKKISIELVKV